MGAVVLIVPASLLLFIDFPSSYTSSSFFSPPQIHPLQSKLTSTHSYHPHTPHLSSPCLNLPHTSFSRFLLQNHQHVHHTSLAPTFLSTTPLRLSLPSINPRPLILSTALNTSPIHANPTQVFNTFPSNTPFTLQRLLFSHFPPPQASPSRTSICPQIHSLRPSPRHLLPSIPHTLIQPTCPTKHILSLLIPSFLPPLPPHPSTIQRTYPSSHSIHLIPLVFPPHPQTLPTTLPQHSPTTTTPHKRSTLFPQYSLHPTAPPLLTLSTTPSTSPLAYQSASKSTFATPLPNQSLLHHTTPNAFPSYTDLIAIPTNSYPFYKCSPFTLYSSTNAPYPLHRAFTAHHSPSHPQTLLTTLPPALSHSHCHTTPHKRSMLLFQILPSP